MRAYIVYHEAAAFIKVDALFPPMLRIRVDTVLDTHQHLCFTKFLKAHLREETPLRDEQHVIP
jgi:hypothetical protein